MGCSGAKEGVDRTGGLEPSVEHCVTKNTEEEHFHTPCALSSQPSSGSEGDAPRTLLALASERMTSSLDRGLCSLSDEDKRGAAQDDKADTRAYVIAAAGDDSLATAEGVSLTQPLLSGEAAGRSVPPDDLLDVSISGALPELPVAFNMLLISEPAKKKECSSQRYDYMLKTAGTRS